MSGTGNGAAHEAGQTLIEMLVALAIMMLVVGLGAPMIGRLLTRQTMIEAQGALTIEVAEARSDAVAHAGAVRVRLAADGTRLVPSTARAPRVLPAGAVVDWPRDGVVFFGDGSATAWDGAIHVDAATRRSHLDATRARLDFGT